MNRPTPALRIHSFLILIAVASTLALSPPAAVADNVDAASVKKWEKLLPAEPRGVGRPSADRAAWEGVKKNSPKWKDYIARAEKLIGKPIPEVTDDLYLEYSRNGNRSRCQRVMFERRKRVTALVIAECLENKGRFLTETERLIRAICAEKSWVLPAHDRGLTNFKGTQVTVDLFSSEAGFQLATVAYWLGERLSPETRKIINAELERRVFEPFEGAVKSNKPKLWWLHCTNNWNAVCLANVTGAALTAIDSPRRRAFYMAAAEQHIKHFLIGFTPDGYCSEGLSYWGYGFGHFTLLAEIISQQTDGRVELWDSGTAAECGKLRRIAQFPFRMEIISNIYPAFADCDLTSRPARYLTAYLNRRLSLGWGHDAATLLTLDDSIRNPVFFGAFGFANSATRRAQAETEARELQPVDWYDDAGVLICRPGAAAQDHCKMGVAIKGGHNAEHHNHNDVGTFIVVVGKHVPLVDPGREVYTRRTFSGKRYDSGVLNSWGHPVPRVAGKLQRTGRSAAAKVLSENFAAETDTITFDISPAYKVKQLKRLERTFVYSRKGDGSLHVTDVVEFDSPQSFGTALITFDKWETIEPKSPEPKSPGPKSPGPKSPGPKLPRSLNTKTIRVGQGAGAVDVLIECKESPIEIRPETIDEDITHTNQKPTRLGIELTKPVEKATLRMTIRPVGN